MCAKTTVSTDILFLFYFDVIRRDSAEFWCNSWGVLVSLCSRTPSQKNMEHSVHGQNVWIVVLYALWYIVHHRCDADWCRHTIGEPFVVPRTCQTFENYYSFEMEFIKPHFRQYIYYRSLDSSEKNEMIGRFVHRNYRFGTCTSSSFRTLECFKALETMIQCSDAI